MIRHAFRSLSARPNNREAEVILGADGEGVPTVSVDLRARFAGNPAYTSPGVLRVIAAELLQGAAYLEESINDDT